MVGRLPFAVGTLICTAVAVQPVGVPVVTFGADDRTAALALAPCVMMAPPPTSFGLPTGHVTVEAADESPATELPVNVAALPDTTTVLVIVPAGPAGPCAPVAPVAPVSPLGPCRPVAPVGPCSPVAPC